MLVFYPNKKNKIAYKAKKTKDFSVGMDLKILICEDERIVGLDILKTIRNMGYSNSFLVSGSVDLIEAGIKKKPDLIITDIDLNNHIDGITAIENIRRFIPAVPVIYITGLNEKKIKEIIKNDNLCHLIIKPYNDLELKEAIKECMKKIIKD